jgi:ABC-type iron transport system FetAB permease component
MRSIPSETTGYALRVDARPRPRIAVDGLTFEVGLALGASPRQRTAGMIRRSVRLAAVPVIDSTKTMGIVSRTPPGVCSRSSS